MQQGTKGSKVSKGLRGMTSILLIMKFVLRLLRSNKTATQREIYYVYPHHFKTQAQCNDAILECASLLGVEREQLNLRASSRGLYAGMVRVWEPGIGEVDGTLVKDPMSISSHWITDPAVPCDASGARFILVVEKEGACVRACVRAARWQRVLEVLRTC